MRKGDSQGANAIQMTASALLGGLLALGIELVFLLLGAVAVSKGILKETAGVQLTAAACVIGCFIGGRLTCARWGGKRLFAGLTVGAVCFLLILAVGLLNGGDIQFGAQGMVELAACLCGGAAAGFFGGRSKPKKRNTYKGKRSGT